MVMMILPVDRVTRSGVSMSRLPSQYNQKIQLDLSCQFSEVCHNS